ncbi:MAG: lytic transglycosylase domain-containing protein [Candidatus Marinimicrobia bacterium]|nr:lytic transglycosylase domain-containing protein [Candidatus Neomarinimicrobiota bacterium]
MAAARLSRACAALAKKTGALFAPLAVVAVLAGACAADGNADQGWGGGDARGSRIKALVVAEAVRMGVSPALALAVAHAESSFDAGAESSKGARGVMQVMPATAKYEYGIDPDLLWNPRINIRVGLHFLRRLLDRYRGRIDLALSYYNGGSAVGTLPHARVIPATARYVARVRRLQAHYRHRLRRGEV